MSVAIFIDTNQYLDLYRMVPGKELLEAIEEQRKYIFVSTQIVDEVMRRKLDCAACEMSVLEKIMRGGRDHVQSTSMVHTVPLCPSYVPRRSPL